MEYSTILFLNLSDLIMFIRRLATVVSPWIWYKFLSILFCILSLWEWRLNLISFATSSHANPTLFAYSSILLFSLIIFSFLESILSISYYIIKWMFKLQSRIGLYLLVTLMLFDFICDVDPFWYVRMHPCFFWLGVLLIHCSYNSSILLPFVSTISKVIIIFKLVTSFYASVYSKGLPIRFKTIFNYC